jgi:alkanesulfonate monooxygenase SsuD/methylene tetrahydromethanopterin reductase-like flavin-dependent oxidoreductase (luciferase family)
MAVILGGTEAEARAKKEALAEALPMERKVADLTRRTGLPPEVVEEYLDRPFPVDLLIPDDQFKGGTGWRRSMVELALKENLTVRELMYRAPGPHQHVVGTAEMVADFMQERLDAGAGDGFTMMVDMLPRACTTSARCWCRSCSGAACSTPTTSPPPCAGISG